jgi:putative endonuclease
VTIARKQTGRLAEDFVAGRLAHEGWRIVARNERTRHGEIDLIGLDGDALVFVEVKAARAGTVHGPERPALAVGPDKRRRLRRLAAAWLAERPPLPRFEELRFDVVGVMLGPGDEVAECEHIRNAF